MGDGVIRGQCTVTDSWDWDILPPKERPTAKVAAVRPAKGKLIDFLAAVA